MNERSNKLSKYLISNTKLHYSTFVNSKNLMTFNCKFKWDIIIAEPFICRKYYKKLHHIIFQNTFISVTLVCVFTKKSLFKNMYNAFNSIKLVSIMALVLVLVLLRNFIRASFTSSERRAHYFCKNLCFPFLFSTHTTTTISDE